MILTSSNDHTAPLSGDSSSAKRTNEAHLVEQALMRFREVAIAWMKPLDLRPPAIQPPHEGPELLEEGQWQAYPNPGPIVACCHLAINHERMRLYTVAVELIPLVLSGNPQDSPLPGQSILDPVVKLQRLDDIEQKLLQWYQQLPAGAKVECETDSPPAGPLANLQYVPSSWPRRLTINLHAAASRIMASTSRPKASSSAP